MACTNAPVPYRSPQGLQANPFSVLAQFNPDLSTEAILRCELEEAVLIHQPRDLLDHSTSRTGGQEEYQM